MKTLTVLLVVMAYSLCHVQAETVTASLHGRTIQVGQPVTYQNLTAFPIEVTGQIETRSNYLTFEQANEKKYLTVDTAAKGAPVGTVSVTNKAKLPVYLMAGDVIISGQPMMVVQNNVISGTPDHCVARDTVVPPGAEQLPVDVYRANHGSILDLKPEAMAQRQLVQNETARYVDEICSSLRQNRRCVGAVFVLNGKVVAADIWGNRGLWRGQMDKMVRSFADDEVRRDKRWKGKSEIIVTAQDAAALLERYNQSKRKVMFTADDLTTATVSTADLLGFETDAGSTLMHCVIYTPRSGMLQRPGVPRPPRMNLVLIPLRVLQADAPANLATRVTSELQVECARHNTINICELSLRSPLMKRALELCDGDENAQNNLREDYRLVADAATDATTRREAATRLIQPLGVDAVLYGTIDVYAFTTKPSPNQTLISLTVEKVTLGEDAECEPVHLLGCSFIRSDGGGSKETHDLEAVTAAGGELARLLSYPWWLPGLPTTTVIW